MLHSGPVTPQLERVTVNYLPKNVAPDFDEVNVQSGVRYQPVARPGGVEITLSTNPSGSPSQPKFEPPPPSVHDTDSIGIRWTVMTITTTRWCMPFFIVEMAKLAGFCERKSSRQVLLV